MRCRYLWLILIVICTSCTNPDHALQQVNFESEDLYKTLRPLGQSIGNSQIVLLGENGHGVSEFTSAKVEMIKWLYETQGFETIVFESGLFECGSAWTRIDTLSSADALFQCLRYPFQHAELLPLFDFIREKHNTTRPLMLAGMDFQAQGYDSELRPTALHDVLNPINAQLADDLAKVDSLLHLPAALGGKGDDLYTWAYENSDALKQTYLDAAEVTDGWHAWTFRLSTGWIDRLAARGEAELQGKKRRPASYYALRDEWMARAVAAHADSIDAGRKVIVWLHNDHGRYGKVAYSEVRSSGNYLKEWYGDKVYSVGFFMGEGVIADNGRNEKTIAVLDSAGIEMKLAADPASYLVLRGNSNTEIQAWSSTSQPYLRMGLDPMELIPADEFDALVYIGQVRVPDYNVRKR